MRMKHLRTGHYYEVISHGLNEADLTPVVVYQSEETGIVWVRSAKEFWDGRFAVALDDGPDPDAPGAVH